MVLCKVSGEALKDCAHCKTTCSKFNVPVGQCAHCNVSTFKERVEVKGSNKRVSQPKLPKSTGISFKLTGFEDGSMVSPIDHPIPELFEGPGITIKDPNKFTCSFCLKDFSVLTAPMTEGITDIKKSIKTEIDLLKNEIVEKVTHYTVPAKACPSCCHLIKPLLDRDGNVKNWAVKRGPIRD